jgi:hypothetical protein
MEDGMGYAGLPLPPPELDRTAYEKWRAGAKKEMEKLDRQWRLVGFVSGILLLSLVFLIVIKIINI